MNILTSLTGQGSKYCKIYWTRVKPKEFQGLKATYLRTWFRLRPKVRYPEQLQAQKIEPVPALVRHISRMHNGHIQPDGYGAHYQTQAHASLIIAPFLPENLAAKLLRQPEPNFLFIFCFCCCFMSWCRDVREAQNYFSLLSVSLLILNQKTKERN